MAFGCTESKFISVWILSRRPFFVYQWVNLLLYFVTAHIVLLLGKIPEQLPFDYREEPVREPADPLRVFAPSCEILHLPPCFSRNPLRNPHNFQDWH